MTSFGRFLPLLARNVCQNSMNKLARPQFRNTGTGRLNEFDKKMLVKAKYFKDVASVPEHVSEEMLKKAQDIGRVRRNVIMFAGTVVAGLFMIMLGRYQHRAGQRVQLDQIRQMSELREEGIKEAAAKNK